MSAGGLLTTHVALALAISCGVAMTATSATAEDQVTLILSGEAFDGPPAFRLEMGNRQLTGRVTQAIDTEEVGRLPFPVPARHRRGIEMSSASLDEVEEITFSFINDAREADVGDRNLVVIAAFINSTRIPLDAFASSAGSAPVPINDVLFMSRNGSVVLTPTPFGWPGTESYASAVSDARVSCRMDGAACPDALMVSFDSANEADFSGVSARALDSFVAQVAERLCTVSVAGYASTGGSEAFNLELAESRAETVAMALASAGVARNALSTIGGGETSQFGPAQADNRVAVITPLACIEQM